MKNILESSAKRSHFIQRLKQLRKRLKQTQEEVFLDGSITMLKAGDDFTAKEYLKFCIKSFNLTQGETFELKMIIRDLSRSGITIDHWWLYWFIFLWDSVPLENKVTFIVTMVIEIIKIASSISLYKNEYKNNTCGISIAFESVL